VVISGDARHVFATTRADVVLHATTAFAREAHRQIVPAIDAGLNVITICQELVYPRAETTAIAGDLDARAKTHSVSALAIGVNPGFVMDVIPITLSAVCWTVTHVHVRRVVDFSPYGPDEMRHIGAGRSPEDFRLGVADGTIGHVGLLESATMIAGALGWRLDALSQTKTPIVSPTHRVTRFVTIEPGSVCGFRQSVTGTRLGSPVLELEMIGLVSPDPAVDGVELGDWTRIQGEPNIECHLKGEVAQKGGLATAAIAVNMIPQVLNAPPGFHTARDLPFPSAWLSDLREIVGRRPVM
jgi:4-hydroxy-tetrahydrodipicolinate reductase